MEIRKGLDSDIPKIISLLKISLGESLIPKSVDLWNWKHLQNPYGKSPVLLAIEGEEIVGVRAFLRWEFVVDGKILKACRAVDTAVHPEFQGKRIFNELTLSLIEEIKEEGVDLVFNSPNSASLPGYLKMGWEKWGKLPLKLDFHLTVGKNMHPLQPESWSKIQPLVNKIEGSDIIQDQNQSHLKSGFLQWRYLDCPLFPYYFISDYHSFLLFYRIKEGKMGREVRITDLFTTQDFGKDQNTHLKKSLHYFQKISGARFTSFSGLKYQDQNILSLGHLPILKAGPIVTLRKINEELDPFEINWKWSLGDLEIF